MTSSSPQTDRAAIEQIATQIQAIARDRAMTLMEVCGTHTMAIARSGIKRLLPQSIRLISGPGCPVCVTPNDFLDHAIAIAQHPNVTICTFGDLMRVPASRSSLERERALGADIKPVYSTLDALAWARAHRDRECVFLGVGFETTAPTIAAAIRMAASEHLTNFSVLSACRTIPNALRALLSGPVALQGLILPGHVSSIIGAHAYRELLARHRVTGVITGFEPIDLMKGILQLTQHIADHHPSVEIEYERAVSEEGNKNAQALLAEIFEPCDATWRGIGMIPDSGLRIRASYAAYDAAHRFQLKLPTPVEPQGCICGKILTGQAIPVECPLFCNTCTPEHPIGACMVSSEGTCAAAARFEGGRDGP